MIAKRVASCPLVKLGERQLGGGERYMQRLNPHAVASVPLPLSIAKHLLPTNNQTVVPEDDGWGEVAKVPLGCAFIVGIGWLFFDWCLRKRVRPRLGCDLDDEGMPRWRCATGIATQLLVFPTLFVLSLASFGFSFSTWSRTAGSAFFTETGVRFYDWAFMYVFAAYMLQDVIVCRELSFMMKLHHVGCLLGLFFAFAGCPSGFPYFVAGAVALEAGSAALNVYCLYPHRRDAQWLFVIGMSSSNAAAVLCCAAWLCLSFPLAAKVFAGGLTGTFVYIRQNGVTSVLAAKHEERKRA